MTATDELRRLLDERGVEGRYKDERTTYWYGTLDGGEWGEWTATEMGGHLHLTFSANGDTVTPEEAIAATLGVTDATATRQGDAGTCHDTQEDEERFCCSECGKKSYIVTQYREFDEYGTKTAGWIEVCTPHFCPNCGRRVVGVDE